MRINVLVLLDVLLCFISCFLKVVLDGLDGEIGLTVAVGEGNVVFVKFGKPASFGLEGKTSLGDRFLVVGDFESNGRSKYEISRGEVDVFIGKSRVDVFEEVVVEDVVESEELVEEEVSARRRRARGIVSWWRPNSTIGL